MLIPHLCFSLQAGQTEVAANAAYTFTLHRPDHEQMNSNLQFYLTLPGITQEGLVDLELLPNQVRVTVKPLQ